MLYSFHEKYLVYYWLLNSKCIEKVFVHLADLQVQSESESPLISAMQIFTDAGQYVIRFGTADGSCKRGPASEVHYLTADSYFFFIIISYCICYYP